MGLALGLAALKVSLSTIPNLVDPEAGHDEWEHGGRTGEDESGRPLPSSSKLE